MKRLLVFAALFTLLTSLDIWLQPDRFHYSYGDEVLLKHILKPDPNEIDTLLNTLILRSSVIYFGGERDDVESIWSKPKFDSLQLPLYHQGTIMFTSILGEEINASKYLTKMHQHSMKTILQMDQKFDDTYMRRTDLPVDIQLQQHPYKLSSPAVIKVKLFVNNELVSFSEIEVTHIAAGGHVTKEQITTNVAGEATFQIIPAGTWTLKAVGKKQNMESGKEIESIQTGTCTWGYH